MDALLAIMGKPEVMYAWEHGFAKKDVRKWINRQLTRYRKDGFGYFAVILKESGAVDRTSRSDEKYPKRERGSRAWLYTR